MRLGTPHARRMRDLSSRMPMPLWRHKADRILQAHVSRLAEMDLEFQAKMRELNRRFPLFVLSRMEGSSGFRMATLLRCYFVEYMNRIISYGPHTLPLSFNAVEAFLSFNEDFKVFDLRQEREHLLRLHDYFDWYTSDNGMSEEPRVLMDIMEEDLIYSFDLAGDTGEFTTSTENSNIAIAGVSLIRHQNELSVILLAGENPPNPPDSEILAKNISEDFKASPGHEEIAPSQDLSIQDRYLDGMVGFSKVITLTRLNLESNTHDLRYVNLDIGPSYVVLTDDKGAIADIPKKDHGIILEQSIQGLRRYGQLFSALASLIYLPIMFISDANRIVESKFVTGLYLKNQNHDIKKAIREFGVHKAQLHRIVKCFISFDTNNLVQEGGKSIEPPNFAFESTGFWRPLERYEIGTDKDGNPVVGKTWVERTDSYSVCSPDSFVIRNVPKTAQGIDPGVVYIVRSAAHGLDIYKVGLTRRSAENRARELGASTGVPLPFEVLASWEVGNCSSVEQEVHRRLNKYRLNKNREFFRASLSTIIAAVEQTIADHQ